MSGTVVIMRTKSRVIRILCDKLCRYDEKHVHRTVQWPFRPNQSFNRDNFERKKTIGILFVIITRYLVKIVDLLYYESFNWYFLKLLPVCVFQTVHAKRNSAIFHSNFICSFVLVSKRSLISQTNGISRSICDVSITVDRSQRAVYSQYSTSCVMPSCHSTFSDSIWAFEHRNCKHSACEHIR